MGIGGVTLVLAGKEAMNGGVADTRQAKETLPRSSAFRRLSSECVKGF